MSGFNLDSNISREKKDSTGGVQSIYVMPFVKYNRREMLFDEQRLILFPSTMLISIHSEVSSFTENPELTPGGTMWDQTLTFEVQKSKASRELFKMLKQQWSIVIVDELGNNRILGLRNGLDVTYTNETGNEKGEFNGYRITATGMEDRQALFIADLIATGFTFPVEPDNFVFDDGCNFVFDNGDNYIFD
tara:strand:- start:169 stop:738 length:570 start_codon:yes stop_codon:yes gene_type:complete